MVEHVANVTGNQLNSPKGEEWQEKAEAQRIRQDPAQRLYGELKIIAYGEAKRSVGGGRV